MDHEKLRGTAAGAVEVTAGKGTRREGWRGAGATSSSEPPGTAYTQIKEDSLSAEMVTQCGSCSGKERASRSSEWTAITDVTLGRKVKVRENNM